MICSTIATIWMIMLVIQLTASWHFCYVTSRVFFEFVKCPSFHSWFCWAIFECANSTLHFRMPLSANARLTFNVLSICYRNKRIGTQQMSGQSHCCLVLNPHPHPTTTSLVCTVLVCHPVPFCCVLAPLRTAERKGGGRGVALLHLDPLRQREEPEQLHCFSSLGVS